MPEPPVPTFHAMLICDTAIREEGTGKISLIGIFARISSAKFPAVHGAFCVYVNLGDAEGPYALKLDLVRADQDIRVIGSAEAQVTFVDRMLPAEMIFELKGLVFEGPGRYEFVLGANGRHIGRKSFEVVKLAPAPEGPANGS